VRKGGTLGFLKSGESDEDREAESKIQQALKSTFRPEFLNRIDEIIMFSPLTLEQMYSIVDLQMNEVCIRLEEHGLSVTLTDAARKWLAEEGFDPIFGARPLRRALQKHVESPLSVSLLSGQFKEGDQVVVDLDAEKKEIVFNKNGHFEPKKKKSETRKAEPSLQASAKK
jgi:ATP-dependent Clp protease ATP-binding subunit ClpC